MIRKPRATKIQEVASSADIRKLALGEVQVSMDPSRKEQNNDQPHVDQCERRR